MKTGRELHWSAMNDAFVAVCRLAHIEGWLLEEIDAACMMLDPDTWPHEDVEGWFRAVRKTCLDIPVDAPIPAHVPSSPAKAYIASCRAKEAIDRLAAERGWHPDHLRATENQILTALPRYLRALPVEQV